MADRRLRLVPPAPAPARVPSCGHTARTRSLTWVCRLDGDHPGVHVLRALR